MSNATQTMPDPFTFEVGDLAVPVEPVFKFFGLDNLSNKEREEYLKTFKEEGGIIDTKEDNKTVQYKVVLKDKLTLEESKEFNTPYLTDGIVGNSDPYEIKGNEYIWNIRSKHSLDKKESVKLLSNLGYDLKHQKKTFPHHCLILETSTLIGRGFFMLK